MARIREKKLEVLDNDEIPENFNVGKFLFTRKTITYGGKTVQLSNVTKISKYSFRETKKPVFDVSQDLFYKSGAGVLICALLMFLLSSIEFLSSIFMIGFVISLGILIYGYNERQKKKQTDKDYYGLVIETSSGKAENLLTTDKKFIGALFNEITKAMNDKDGKKLVANFSTNQIYYHEDNRKKKVYGDNFENINGSSINNRTYNDKNEYENDDIEAILNEL